MVIASTSEDRTGPTLPLPALILAFCLIWSSAFAAAKIALVDCPPLLMLTGRFIIAGLLLLGITAATDPGWLPGRRDLRCLILLGLLNNAVYLGLSWWSMKTVSSGLAAIVISANPVLTAGLATAFLGERMTWTKAAGLLLGMLGVVFVVRSRVADGAEDPMGVLLLLGALASLVAGTLLFKRLAPQGGLWTGIGVQSLAGGLLLAPVAFALEDPAAIHLTPSLMMSFLYVVAVVSGLGYWLWFHLLGRSSATTASSLHFLMPPLGLLFGWLLLAEPMSWVDILGVVPIAIGIRLATRPQT